MRSLVIRVRGVMFDNRQDILWRLTGNEPARLEPEPDNPHDANAVKVMVATAAGPQHVGYVHRDLAAEIAPLMSGEPLMASRIELEPHADIMALLVHVEVPEEGEEGKLI